MTSANGGHYAGQYPRDGWVDNLEPYYFFFYSETLSEGNNK